MEICGHQAAAETRTECTLSATMRISISSPGCANPFAIAISGAMSVTLATSSSNVGARRSSTTTHQLRRPSAPRIRTFVSSMPASRLLQRALEAVCTRLKLSGSTPLNNKSRRHLVRRHFIRTTTASIPKIPGWVSQEDYRRKLVQFSVIISAASAFLKRDLFPLGSCPRLCLVGCIYRLACAPFDWRRRTRVW